MEQETEHLSSPVRQPVILEAATNNALLLSLATWKHMTGKCLVD